MIISSNSLKCAQAIGNREVFKTRGALYTTDGAMGPWHSGRLTGEDLEAFRRDMGHIIYAVFSYATPIAWVTLDDRVHRVSQKFSVTTSKHQGKTYLLK
jgi:hypothetical protein